MGKMVTIGVAGAAACCYKKEKSIEKWFVVWHCCCRLQLGRQKRTNILACPLQLSSPLLSQQKCVELRKNSKSERREIIIINLIFNKILNDSGKKGYFDRVSVYSLVVIPVLTIIAFLYSFMRLNELLLKWMETLRLHWNGKPFVFLHLQRLMSPFLSGRLAQDMQRHLTKCKWIFSLYYPTVPPNTSSWSHKIVLRERSCHIVKPSIKVKSTEDLYYD